MATCATGGMTPIGDGPREGHGEDSMTSKSQRGIACKKTEGRYQAAKRLCGRVGGCLSCWPAEIKREAVEFPFEHLSSELIRSRSPMYTFVRTKPDSRAGTEWMDFDLADATWIRSITLIKREWDARL